MVATLPVNLATDEVIDETWVDAVRACLAELQTSAVAGGAAIIENATTPAGINVNDLKWSTIHQTLMRWTGTQWVFAGGPPGYFTSSDMWNDGIAPMAATVLLASGTLTQQLDGAGHWGIWRVTSAAGIGSGALLRGTFAVAGGSITTGAGLRFRGVFQMPNVGAGSLVRIGLHDAATAALPVDGAWLEVVAGVASLKTSWASVVTTSATATLAGFTWYTVHIWFPTATTCRCVVVSDAGVVLLDVTNSSNIPPGGAKVNPAALAYVTTATAMSPLDLDWMGWGYAPV